jgi:hypothetical protein
MGTKTKFWSMLAMLAASALVHAQSDVGLVNLVAGDVSFVPQAGQPGKVKAFMKVREGDRFELPAGAQVRVVYFDGARQERWQGPASFRALKLQGAPINGAPAEVARLPAATSARMSRVPELMQNAKLGGIQVRGAQSSRPVQKEAVEDARTTYQALRKQLAPDDITPELFLFSTLNDYQLYEEMAPLVDEMRRKQPDSDDVKSLASWLGSRRGTK